MSKHRKHIVLSDVHMDIVSDLIANTPGVNSFSEAVRYALLSMDGKSDGTINDRKINAMSKQIDILVEMVAGGLHELDVKAIGSREETYIYQDAKNIVENNIQRSTTERKENKNKKVSFTKKREIF